MKGNRYSRAKWPSRRMVAIAVSVLAVAAVLTLLVGLIGLRWPASPATIYREIVTPDKHRQGPVVDMIRTEWDFGRVGSGPALRAEFPVRNVGTRRLILRQRSSSCECLSASRPEVIVEPGDTRMLTAEVVTEHLRGPLRMELHYATNDPARPVLTLIVLADVGQ